MKGGSGGVEHQEGRKEIMAMLALWGVVWRCGALYGVVWRCEAFSTVTLTLAKPTVQHAKRSLTVVPDRVDHVGAAVGLHVAQPMAASRTSRTSVRWESLPISRPVDEAQCESSSWSSLLVEYALVHRGAG
jgi:hypothetical protein